MGKTQWGTMVTNAAATVLEVVPESMLEKVIEKVTDLRPFFVYFTHLAFLTGDLPLCAKPFPSVIFVDTAMLKSTSFSANLTTAFFTTAALVFPSLFQAHIQPWVPQGFSILLYFIVPCMQLHKECW